MFELVKYNNIYTLFDASGYYVTSSDDRLSERNCEEVLGQDSRCMVDIKQCRVPADLAPGGWDVYDELDTDGRLVLNRK